jgi:hypothetical protein
VSAYKHRKKQANNRTNEHKENQEKKTRKQKNRKKRKQKKRKQNKTKKTKEPKRKHFFFWRKKRKVDISTENKRRRALFPFFGNARPPRRRDHRPYRERR